MPTLLFSDKDWGQVEKAAKEIKRVFDLRNSKLMFLGLRPDGIIIHFYYMVGIRDQGATPLLRVANNKKGIVVTELSDAIPADLTSRFQQWLQ